MRALRYPGLFLVGVEFADEFASGVPYASAFAVQGALAVGGAALNVWTFFVPQVFALVVEPYLLLRSEHWGYQRSLQIGLFGMGASLVLGALAPSAALLGLAVALYFPSSGLACGVAQVLLVDDSDERAESMTDWTLAGTLGDLGTPLLFWALDAGGLSWRWTFALVGVTVLLFTAATPPQGALGATSNQGGEDNHDGDVEHGAGPKHDADLEHDENTDQVNEPVADDEARRGGAADAEEPTWWQALRLVIRKRALLWWLLATASCSLLDELFASQIGVHLAHDLGVTASTRVVSAQLIAMGVGGALGLLLQRRLLTRHSPRRLLAWSSAATPLVFGLWLLALPSAATLSLPAAPTHGAFTNGAAVYGEALQAVAHHGVAWCFAALLGALIATHYPLAQAQAYDLLPGRANVVAAASQAFSGIDLFYPVLVGLLSDNYHPAVGLCALLLQPLAIVTALAVTRRNARGS